MSMLLGPELAACCGLVFCRLGSAPNGAFGRCRSSTGNSDSFRNVNTRDTRPLPIRASLTTTPSDGACLSPGSQVSVHPTKVSSVMAGMETPPGHRICLSRCDKVQILRKHRDESLVCASRTRVGCGHVSGLAACFSTAHKGGLEAGEHPVWVFPLSHKMTPFLYPNAQQPPQLAGVGCALAPRGFPGASSRSLPEPFFRTSPDCRDSRAA